MESWKHAKHVSTQVYQAHNLADSQPFSLKNFDTLYLLLTSQMNLGFMLKVDPNQITSPMILDIFVFWRKKFYYNVMVT